MEPVQDQFCDPNRGNKQHVIPLELSRVAVVCSEALIAVQYWPSKKSAELVARLAREEQINFEYFPVRYTGAGAAESVKQAFAQLQARGAEAFDLILVIGDASGEADIGVVHQVLAPSIAGASVPVLTALGPDDGETILGDTACKVFPTTLALAEFLSGITQQRYLLADQVLARIKSLGQFLLAEHEVESKILLKSVLQPTLQRHLDYLTVQLDETAAAMRGVTQQLHLRLLREEAVLEQFRARIGVELARIAKNNAARVSPMTEDSRPRPIGDQKALKGKIDKVRTTLLLTYLLLIGLLWWQATPGNAIFFGGSALVILSALYVAICNRLIDSANRHYHDIHDDEFDEEPSRPTGQMSGQPLQNATDHSMFDIPTIDSLDVGRLRKSNRIEPWL